MQAPDKGSTVHFVSQISYLVLTPLNIPVLI